jgi:alkylated DNA nucleotide flippase Atl1
LNKNPFAPEVPCHRVVKSNGELGGFADDLSVNLPKKWSYLSSAQKNEIERKLEQNIKKSIKTMHDLGLYDL